MSWWERIFAPKGERVRDRAKQPRLADVLDAERTMPHAQGLQGTLDALALGTTTVPVVGDVAGLASDAYRYATDPESRTWGNAALSAAGALPFVPSMMAATGAVHIKPWWSNADKDAVEVLLNPNDREMREMFREGGREKNHLRTVVLPDGDVAVFGGDMLHNDVTRHYGIDPPAKDKGLIYNDRGSPRGRHLDRIRENGKRARGQ